MYVGLLSFDIDSSCSCCLSIYNCHLAAWLFHGSLLWVSFIRLFCGSLLQVSCECMWVSSRMTFIHQFLMQLLPVDIQLPYGSMAVLCVRLFFCKSLFCGSLLRVCFLGLFYRSFVNVCGSLLTSVHHAVVASRCKVAI